MATPIQRLLHLYPHQWFFSKELKTCAGGHSSNRSPMKLRVRASMDVQLPPPSPPSTCHWIQHALNVSSRWVVLATAATVVMIWRDHDQVLWASTGSVLNSASSKILKKIFNQQRPLTAVGLKADPGMPSSHAQSLGFLALYAAFGVISWLGLNMPGIASASLVLFGGSYLAWLRISQGLHTPLQVIVGAGFGCSMATLWIVLWHYVVKEVVASSIVYHYFLVGIFGLSALSFLAFGACKWRLGDV